MRNFLTFFIIAITLVSCDSKHILDEYKTIPNTWKKDTVINFNFKAPDTSSTFNLFVNIRNNNNYEFSNLFLIVNLTSPRKQHSYRYFRV